MDARGATKDSHVPAAVAARARGGCGRRRRRPGRHAAGPQGARDDREGHRRHRAAQSYNTAIAAIMELVNELSRDTATRRGSPPRRPSASSSRTRRTSPRRWAVLGHERLWEAPWPVADEAMLERETFESDPGERPRPRPHRGRGDAVRRRARGAGQGLGEGAGASDGKDRQAIVVPRKLVNFVV